MGRYQRMKGRKGVNEVLDKMAGDGFDVQSVEASGAIRRETGDIVLRYQRKKYNIEVKRERALPTQGLEKRKADCDILVMRQDRDDWKVYMDLDTLMFLLLHNRT